MDAAMTNQTEQRPPATWLRSWGAALPWGFVGGLIALLPFLLAKQGVPFDQITRMVAFTRLPLNLSFLIMPLLDSGWSRSRYSALTILVTAVFTAVGTVLLFSGHLQLAMWVLLIGFLGIRLYDAAVLGWIAQFTRHLESGAVGAWDIVVTSIGGTVITLLCTVLLTRWSVPKPLLGAAIGLLILLGACPVVFFPRAEPARFRFREVPTTTLKAVWRAVRRPECLIGFLLFASPLGTSAASGLQHALSKDFHTPDATVVWLISIGTRLFGSLGAPIGGKLATRWSEKLPYVYLFCCLGVSGTSVVTACLPHTQTSFVGSILFDRLAWGAQVAVYHALVLQLVRNSPVATTQISLFASAFYLSQSYMSLVDGVAYKHGGVKALFLVDGLPGLLLAIPVFFVIRAWLARKTETALAAV